MGPRASRKGEPARVDAIHIASYLPAEIRRGPGVVGFPTPHFNFHRPIHVHFQAFFQAGFVLDLPEEANSPSAVDHSRPLLNASL